MTDGGEASAAVDRIGAEAGRLDVLVNNAGIGGPDGPIGLSTPAEIDRTIEPNLRGPTRLCQQALPLLLRRTAPRIVTVSSRGSQLASGVDESRGAYCVTKAGVNAPTDHLDGAYADRGPIVISASPGWVRTGIGGDRAPPSPTVGADTPVGLARFREGALSGDFWQDRERIDR